MSILIDAGANADCKPRNLVEFGVMGEIYYKKIFGVENPKVAIVNIGAEEGKGNELTKKSYELLKKTRYEFYRKYRSERYSFWKNRCNSL